MRSARRVAADELDTMPFRECVEAAREGRQPSFVDVRQRTGEKRPPGLGTHRRHVGKIHCERLVAKLLRIDVGEEMPACDQHVDRNRELAPG